MTGFKSKRKAAQPEQKLMVYEFGCSQCGHTQNEEIDIPQRPWVGLTDEEIDNCWYQSGGVTPGFARATEAKLKEKNFD